MTRAAPSQSEILDLAAEINGIVSRGFVALLPDRAMTQMHSAAPGKPGLGIRIFQEALGDHVAARTTNEGDWRFYRKPHSDAERGSGLLATSDRLPGSATR